MLAVLAVVLLAAAGGGAAAESSEASAKGMYHALFNFGDSLADAGNLIQNGTPEILATARLPYGQTYFGKPTGRCSDGRLVIDHLGTYDGEGFASAAFVCSLPRFGCVCLTDGFPGLPCLACSARVWPAAAAAVQGQERQLRARRQLRHHRRHRARHALLRGQGARCRHLELRSAHDPNPVVP